MQSERENFAASPPPPRRVASALTGNPYLVLAFASLCWSGNHLLGRAIADHVPPIGISTVRWILAAMILWPFARPHLQNDWPTIARHRGIIISLAVTGGALFGVVQFVGLQYTTAVNVSVFNSLSPVLIVAAGALMFRDRLSAFQIAGIVTSLIGVLVIVTRADIHVLASLGLNRGDLLIVMNMGIWGVYSACLRLRPQIHGLSFLFLFVAISAVAMLPLFAWEHFSGYRFQPTLLTAFAVLYVAVVNSILAFLAWNRGVDLIGANRAGVFLHLIPLYTALLAGALLGETLMPYHFLGFGLILAGVWLAARSTA